MLVLGGTLGFVSCPAVRAMEAVRTEPREGPARETSRMWLRGSLPQAVAVSAAVGLCLGVPGLLVVAFAEQRGQVEMVAWIEAAQAVGSALGGAVYGAVSWRISLRVRLPLLAAALGLALAVAGLAPNVYALMAVLFVAGVFTAPALTTGYLLADESAAPEHRTQAGAWVNTAFNTGFSGGNAAAGLLASRLPLALCFSIAAIPALLSTTTTLRRPKRSPEPLTMTSSAGSGPDE
ncbi:MFS transporter [Sphaerisporangium sp. NBC_01403]|uniref:MFS transporter n=1 Tax=Sphaerisporangium sp. NBC_01403 TaxID=2903599 RepID=UPI0032434BB4